MITIRDAVPADAVVLADAEKKIAETPGYLASRPHELSEDAFRSKIESLSQNPNGTYVVAEKDGCVIAHGLLEPMSLESIRHVVRLTIAVHEGYQEKGAGERLLRHLIDWAKSAPQVEKIELHVRSTNTRAIRLYEKLGFHFEGRLKNRIRFPDGRFIDELEMGLFVKKAPVSVPFVGLSIGIVRSDRKQAFDDGWDRVEGSIELDASQFTPEALIGLESFSHVEVIFFMDQVDRRQIQGTSSHPWGNLNWPKVGIFAQRRKDRPNQIGLCVCRIKRVDGLRIDLEGLDAIDGSPVLDIKPWVKEFGPRGEIRQPEWMDELMASYWSGDAPR